MCRRHPFCLALTVWRGLFRAPWGCLSVGWARGPGLGWQCVKAGQQACHGVSAGAPPPRKRRSTARPSTPPSAPLSPTDHLSPPHTPAAAGPAATSAACLLLLLFAVLESTSPGPSNRCRPKSELWWGQLGHSPSVCHNPCCCGCQGETAGGVRGEGSRLSCRLCWLGHPAVTPCCPPLPPIPYPPLPQAPPPPLPTWLQASFIKRLAHTKVHFVHLSVNSTSCLAPPHTPSQEITKTSWRSPTSGP